MEILSIVSFPKLGRVMLTMSTTVMRATIRDSLHPCPYTSKEFYQNNFSTYLQKGKLRGLLFCLIYTKYLISYYTLAQPRNLSLVGTVIQSWKEHAGLSMVVRKLVMTLGLKEMETSGHTNPQLPCSQQHFSRE